MEIYYSLQKVIKIVDEKNKNNPIILPFLNNDIFDDYDILDIVDKSVYIYFKSNKLFVSDLYVTVEETFEKTVEFAIDQFLEYSKNAKCIDDIFDYAYFLGYNEWYKNKFYSEITTNPKCTFSRALRN